jgi:hypothetical protein
VAGHGGEYRLRHPHAADSVEDDVDDGEDYDGPPGSADDTG